MKIHLLNSIITPFISKKEGELAVFMAEKITKEKYEEILMTAKKEQIEVESFLGHQSTVEFLASIFPEEIKHLFKFNRLNFYFEEGDMALVFRITERGNFLKEHSFEEIKELYEKDFFEFVFISRITAPEIVLNPKNIIQFGG